MTLQRHCKNRWGEQKAATDVKRLAPGLDKTKGSCTHSIGSCSLWLSILWCANRFEYQYKTRQHMRLIIWVGWPNACLLGVCVCTCGLLWFSTICIKVNACNSTPTRAATRTHLLCRHSRKEQSVPMHAPRPHSGTHAVVFACFAGGSSTLSAMGHRDTHPRRWWSSNSSPFLITRVLNIIGT